MSKRPREIKIAIEKGAAQIEKAIQEPETKESIDNLIQSYSTLDTISIYGKTTYLVESLRRLCGSKGSELILNVLTRGSSEGAWEAIDQVSSKEVRQFLNTLILKYGAKFQWLLEPFQNDWQRYYISTKYSGTPLMPIVSARIINKKGEPFELESPLRAYVNLVAAFVGYLSIIDGEMEKLGQPKAVQKIVTKKKLEDMKKVLEELLENPKEN